MAIGGALLSWAGTAATDAAVRAEGTCSLAALPVVLSRPIRKKSTNSAAHSEETMTSPRLSMPTGPTSVRVQRLARVLMTGTRPG
jgi:hypothetical protein